MPRRKTIHTCETCGKEFFASERLPPEPPRRFCSHRCSEVQIPLLERFLEHVSPEPNTGCWIWTGALNHGDHGYGVTNRSGERQMVYAHRAAWELFRGPIPEGLAVLHNCPYGDLRCCVNPDHLFLGTLGDNNRDTIRKGRNIRGEASHLARLTSTEVLEIRRCHADGEMIFSLARRFGVSHAHIGRIVTRQKWKHLD